MLLVAALSMLKQGPTDMDFLRTVANQIADSMVIPPDSGIDGVGANKTGSTLRVPGGTKGYYPAFWIRDAAMMLGDSFVPAQELRGWIRVVASTQSGPKTLRLAHDMSVPPYSIPDHITLKGEACWYPGAYAEQGVGNYGHLPPADDAYYYIQMVDELVRLTGDVTVLDEHVQTPYGTPTILESCLGAFESVGVDAETQLVVCSERPNEDRVDWGFCDSIRKSGLCLMPSLLRYQATGRMANWFQRKHLFSQAAAARRMGNAIRNSIVKKFWRPVGPGEGMLVSATGLGNKDDVWASAFALWLNVLPSEQLHALARHLLRLYRNGEITHEGQVRHLPAHTPEGRYWEEAKSAPDTYQNGGYWATATGWLASALGIVNPDAEKTLVGEYVTYLERHRTQGAPYEWIPPGDGLGVNPYYGSSAILVYISLKQRNFR